MSKLWLPLLFLALSSLAIHSVYGQGTTIPKGGAMTVGPVIGTVTTTTARVLAEFNYSGRITCILSAQGKPSVSSTKDFQKGVPVVFTFSGLSPGVKYEVKFNPAISQVASSFRTLSGKTGELKFALVSCNEYTTQSSVASKSDLWADLSKRIDSLSLDYLIHNGDQVYLDMSFKTKDYSGTAYYKIMDILNKTPKSQWQSKTQELLEIIRDVYRKTWTFPTTRSVLARVPNLMMFDDHDLRNSWGYNPNDTNPNTADYFYGTLARRVYYEYQRQLREDINFNDLSTIKTEYFHVILNGVGFVFLDYRGVKSWFKNPNETPSQLGSQQRNYLTTLFGSNGDFKSLKTVFLVSSFPVVLFGDIIAKLGQSYNEDAVEHWSNGRIDEQVWLLNLLRNWKLASSGRNLMILAGDSHMGGWTDIKYNNAITFKQFTASAMASLQPTANEFLFFSLYCNANYNIKSGFGYKHYNWTRNFNYGLIATAISSGTSVIDAVHVTVANGQAPTASVTSSNKLWNPTGTKKVL